jgi:hypothetical protein
MLVLGRLVFDVEVTAGARLDDEMAESHTGDYIVHSPDDMSSSFVGFLVGSGVDLLVLLDGNTVFQIIGDLDVLCNDLLKLQNDSRDDVLVGSDMGSNPSATVDI